MVSETVHAFSIEFVPDCEEPRPEVRVFYDRRQPQWICGDSHLPEGEQVELLRTPFEGSWKRSFDSSAGQQVNVNDGEEWSPGTPLCPSETLDIIGNAHGTFGEVFHVQ